MVEKDKIQSALLLINALKVQPFIDADIIGKTCFRLRARVGEFGSISASGQPLRDCLVKFYEYYMGFPASKIVNDSK